MEKKMRCFVGHLIRNEDGSPNENFLKDGACKKCKEDIRPKWQRYGFSSKEEWETSGEFKRRRISQVLDEYHTNTQDDLKYFAGQWLPDSSGATKARKNARPKSPSIGVNTWGTHKKPR